MNNEGSKQLPPQGDGRENEVGGLLAAASDFARSVLESIQALAGTTSCKGVQIARLKDWAIANNCWIDKAALGTYSDRGSENEVYASLDSRYVYKLNDFRYSVPFFVNRSSYPSARQLRQRSMKKWNDWDLIKKRMTAISPIAISTSSTQCLTMF